MATSVTTAVAPVATEADDFHDLDAMDFLRVAASKDKMGRPVIFIIARNFHPRLVTRERLKEYILQRCDASADVPYTIAWIHTQSTYWSNCPSISWLWWMYERLPAKFRDNLASVYVLHCDMSMWVGSMVLCPWFSGRLWRKITWINRLEFLWDYMGKVPLPAFITEHDEVLEDQPLTDYGLIATKEMVVAGMTQPL